MSHLRLWFCSINLIATWKIALRSNDEKAAHRLEPADVESENQRLMKLHGFGVGGVAASQDRGPESPDVNQGDLATKKAVNYRDMQ